MCVCEARGGGLFPRNTCRSETLADGHTPPTFSVLSSNCAGKMVLKPPAHTTLESPKCSSKMEAEVSLEFCVKTSKVMSSVMVGFMYHHDWAKGHPDTPLNIILACLRGCF